MRAIRIQPLGGISIHLLDALAAELARIFQVSCRVETAVLDPQFAFEPTRGQYYATAVLERLAASRVSLAGLVVNRMRLWPGDGEGAAPAAISGDATAPLAAALAEAHGAVFPARAAAEAALELARGYASLVQRDARAVEPLAGRVRERGGFVTRIPEFDRDVHDLDGLAAIADRLAELG